MLARAFSAEVQVMTAQIGEDQDASFELQDRCDRQEVQIQQLQALITSQARDLEEQRRINASQETQLDRQRYQIDDLQSRVDEQKTILGECSSNANTLVAKVVSQSQEIHNLKVIVESNGQDILALSANYERASRDAEHFRSCMQRQGHELQEDTLAREAQLAQAEAQLEEQLRFIWTQNDRLEAQTHELVDARRKVGQLSKQLSSVSRSLQLQEDHAVMVSRDAKEIQPKLVELQAVQEALDFHRAQLVERESKIMVIEQVLGERGEELERQRESVQRAEIAATRVLAEAEDIKRRIEGSVRVTALADRRREDSESAPLLQFSCSEVSREHVHAFPNAATMCARSRVARVAA